MPSNCELFLHFFSLFFSFLFCLHLALGPFKNKFQSFWNLSKWISTKFSNASALFLFFLNFHFLFCIFLLFSVVYFLHPAPFKKTFQLQVLSKLSYSPFETWVNNFLLNFHCFQLFFSVISSPHSAHQHSHCCFTGTAFSSYRKSNVFLFLFIIVRMLIQHSPFLPNYFCILSARDIIQTSNGSQDIKLLPIFAAFSNINPILKYNGFKNMNKFKLFLLFST